MLLYLEILRWMSFRVQTLQKLKQGRRNLIRTLNRKVVSSTHNNAARDKFREFLSVS